jgi:MinD-like ATPase involved in chromosome partitioning or flagellar assembly
MTERVATSPAADPTGVVYTFYSYKGGVGRSMALANVAALLARWGKRVLIVDWDLEAPGIEEYFAEFPSKLNGDRAETPGLIDLVLANARGDRLDWRQCLLTARPFRLGQPVSVISAGRRTPDFSARVRHIDWLGHFANHDLGRYLELLRYEWKCEFDYVLIDSRTGVNDIGGICTVLLPDTLVLLFTTTQASMQGALEVYRAAREEQKRLPIDRGNLCALPVPARFDVYGQQDGVERWRSTFAKVMREVYLEWLPPDVHHEEFMRRTYIPYSPSWSFGERLPVAEREQDLADPGSLPAAYLRLARVLRNHLDVKQTGILDVLEGVAGSETRAALEDGRRAASATDLGGALELASVMRAGGSTNDARTLQERVLESAQASSDEGLKKHALRELALTAWREGQRAEAARLNEEADRLPKAQPKDGVKPQLPGERWNSPRFDPIATEARFDTPSEFGKDAGRDAASIAVLKQRLEAVTVGADYERDDVQACLAVVDAYLALGDAHLQDEDFERARENYVPAIAVLDQCLGRHGPRSDLLLRLGEARRRLGSVLLVAGSIGESLVELEDARTVLGGLASSYGDPLHKRAWLSAVEDVAGVMLGAGRHTDAVGLLRWVVEERGALVASTPMAQDPKREHAASLLKLSAAEQAAGDLATAERRARQAVEEYRTLNSAQTSPARMNDVTRAQIALADQLVAKPDGRVEARVLYEAALHSRENLARKHAEYERDLATAHERMGDLLRKESGASAWEQANRHYEHALDISKRLVGEFPRSTILRRELGLAHRKLGDSLRQAAAAEHTPAAARAEEYRGARAHYRESLAITRQLSAAEMPPVEHELDYVRSLLRLADVPPVPEGRAELESALEILERQRQAGRLPPAMQQWIPTIRGLLTLPDDADRRR